MAVQRGSTWVPAVHSECHFLRARSAEVAVSPSEWQGRMLIETVTYVGAGSEVQPGELLPSPEPSSVDSSEYWF